MNNVLDIVGHSTLVSPVNVMYPQSNNYSFIKVWKNGKEVHWSSGVIVQDFGVREFLEANGYGQSIAATGVSLEDLYSFLGDKGKPIVEDLRKIYENYKDESVEIISDVFKFSVPEELVMELSEDSKWY